ncbi:MAG: hypothetical protein ABL921_30325 [Pirellula sp.]
MMHLRYCIFLILGACVCLAWHRRAKEPKPAVDPELEVIIGKLNADTQRRIEIMETFKRQQPNSKQIWLGTTRSPNPKVDTAGPRLLPVGLFETSTAVSGESHADRRDYSEKGCISKEHESTGLSIKGEK